MRNAAADARPISRNDSTRFWHIVARCRIDLVDDLYRGGGLGGDIIAVPTTRYPHGLEATPFGRTILAEAVVVYARPT